MGKLYPVEQRHRDAAADHFLRSFSKFADCGGAASALAGRMRAGLEDEEEAVQSFARFEAEHLTRIEATPAVDREGVWAKARTAAFMLLQHSEGCAANHYGDDLSIHGMPGWLADCRKDLEAADAFLALPPVKQSDGWQDISTAPKDGTPFIIVDAMGLFDIGVWHNDHVCGEANGAGPWTHWQPLPAPPGQQSDDRTVEHSLIVAERVRERAAKIVEQHESDGFETLDDVRPFIASAIRSLDITRMDSDG